MPSPCVHGFPILCGGILSTVSLSDEAIIVKLLWYKRFCCGNIGHTSPVAAAEQPCFNPEAARHIFNMREIVHIQAGQCGNQIGAKFWEVIFSNITHTLRFKPSTKYIDRFNFTCCYVKTVAQRLNVSTAHCIWECTKRVFNSRPSCDIFENDFHKIMVQNGFNLDAP